MKSTNEELRLEKLESDLALQDNTIEELNKFIIAQQQQINELEKKLQFLAFQLRDMKDAVITTNSPEDVPPPHYNQKS